jgi:hypothetical protein
MHPHPPGAPHEIVQGGRLKHLVSASKSVIKTSGNIVDDISKGLANVIGGVSYGLEVVAQGAGKVLSSISNDLAIVSTKVIHRAGDLTYTIAKDLGNIIAIVPILGRPTSYVVKGAGKGVYYLVTTVGNIAGEGIKTVGRLGTDVSNVVVFTIVSTKDVSQKVLREAGDIVKRVTHLVNNKKSNKSKKNIKRKKRKTMRK